MPKKVLAILMVCALLLSGCSQAVPNNKQEESKPSMEVEPSQESIQENPTDAEFPTATETDNASGDISATVDADSLTFNDFTDPAFLQYVEDNVYSNLAYNLGDDDYVIENVEAVYISQEYLDEVAYNSKSNIFFGYTLEEIEEVYQGSPWVFTLGSNGETTVVPYEDYDDTYDQIIRNVAIGTGVILICVTVSVATGGAGLAPISAIFAASAKTATAFALSSGLMGGLSKAIITGIQTGDFDNALKAGELAASEGFKWGAISGALIGGAGEAINQFGAASRLANNAGGDAIRSWRESEQYVQEMYGGSEQMSFLDGQLVPKGTPGSTRPDVVRQLADGTWEAIEVKNYNLANSNNVFELYAELEREIAARAVSLPEGYVQRIVLDVEGRGFSGDLVNSVIEGILTRLAPIYPNIPIDIVGAVI